MAAILASVPGLLGLGLVMGFSPTLYAVALHLLEGGRTGSLRWLVAGLASGSTLLAVLLQFTDPHTWERALTAEIDALALRRWIDLVAGLLMLCGAVVVARRGERRWEGTIRPRRRAATSVGSPRRWFAVGASNTVLGFSGFATMYLVDRTLAAATDHLAWRALLYVAFLTTLVMPYLLVAWWWGRRPGFAAAIQRAQSRLVRLPLRQVVAVLLGIAGIALLVVAAIGHRG